jgi:hypothetical protein
MLNRIPLQRDQGAEIPDVIARNSSTTCHRRTRSPRTWYFLGTTVVGPIATGAMILA